MSDIKVYSKAGSSFHFSSKSTAVTPTPDLYLPEQNKIKIFKKHTDPLPVYSRQNFDNSLRFYLHNLQRKHLQWQQRKTFNETYNTIMLLVSNRKKYIFYS